MIMKVGIFMPDKKYYGRYTQLVIYYNKEDYKVVDELKEEGFNVQKLVKNYLRDKLNHIKKLRESECN